MANCLFFKTCLKRNFIVWFIGRIKIYLLSDYFSLPLYSVMVTKIFKGMCLVIPVECRIFKGWDYLFFTHVHTHEIFSVFVPILYSLLYHSFTHSRLLRLFIDFLVIWKKVYFCHTVLFLWYERLPYYLWCFSDEIQCHCLFNCGPSAFLRISPVLIGMHFSGYQFRLSVS